MWERIHNGGYLHPQLNSTAMASLHLSKPKKCCVNYNQVCHLQIGARFSYKPLIIKLVLYYYYVGYIPTKC